MNIDDLALRGELVRFLASDGIILHGFLCRPAKSRKAVLHLHGLGGSFYRNNTVKEMARTFARKGFSFFAIEQRGSYDVYDFKRYGRRKAQILAGGSLERFEDCRHDIKGAINYLKRIGMKKIYLQGHSSGCQKETYYLSKTREPSVKGMILIAPCDDYNIWRHELKGRFAYAVAFAKRISRKHPDFIMSQKFRKIGYGARRFLSLTDPKNIECRLFDYDRKRLAEFGKIGIPILAVFGTKEQYAVKPILEYIRILKRDTGSGQFSYLFIKGGNHSFEKKEVLLAKGISSWLAFR
jgi:pimeloyl-ACP methyl ester carboxylesterase